MTSAVEIRPAQIFSYFGEKVRVVEAMQISHKYGVAMPANWSKIEVLNEYVIIPPAKDVKTAKERLEKARAGEFECFDWWLCHKKLEK